MDIPKVFETQDVYHLSCYHFNYVIINHLEYWEVYSLLITGFTNNVNKIQNEGVENAFIQLANIYWVPVLEEQKALRAWLLHQGSENWVRKICTQTAITKVKHGKQHN